MAQQLSDASLPWPLVFPIQPPIGFVIFRFLSTSCHSYGSLIFCAIGECMHTHIPPTFLAPANGKCRTGSCHACARSSQSKAWKQPSGNWREQQFCLSNSILRCCKMLSKKQSSKQAQHGGNRRAALLAAHGLPWHSESQFYRSSRSNSALVFSGHVPEVTNILRRRFSQNQFFSHFQPY